MVIWCSFKKNSPSRTNLSVFYQNTTVLKHKCPQHCSFNHFVVLCHTCSPQNPSLVGNKWTYFALNRNSNFVKWKWFLKTFVKNSHSIANFNCGCKMHEMEALHLQEYLKYLHTKICIKIRIICNHLKVLNKNSQSLNVNGNSIVI